MSYAGVILLKVHIAQFVTRGLTETALTTSIPWVVVFFKCRYRKKNSSHNSIPTLSHVYHVVYESQLHIRFSKWWWFIVCSIILVDFCKDQLQDTIKLLFGNFFKLLTNLPLCSLLIESFHPRSNWLGSIRIHIYIFFALRHSRPCKIVCAKDRWGSLIVGMGGAGAGGAVSQSSGSASNSTSMSPLFASFISPMNSIVCCDWLCYWIYNIMLVSLNFRPMIPALFSDSPHYLVFSQIILE